MSNTNRFLYHTLIFGFGGVVAQLVPLILLPLYVNYLTPAEYGITDLIFRASYIVNTVLMVNGVRLALFTFYRQAEDEPARHRVAVTISAFLWVAIVISIAIACVFAGQIDRFLNIGNNSLLVFGMTAIFLESLVAVPMALFQVRFESIRFVLINLTMLLLRLTLCIYLVVWLQMGIWGVLFSQFAINLVFGVMLTMIELFRFPARPDFSLLWPIVRFVWPFIPVGIVGFCCGNMDRFFLTNYGPYTDSEYALAKIGLYALAFRLMDFASVLGASPMQRVWTAQMYDIHKQTGAETVFGNYSLRIVFVQMFFVLGISIFASEIVRTLCSPAYFAAAHIMPIAGLYTCFLIFMNQLESIFYITRKTQYKLINLIILLPITFVLMYLLVPPLGILGAAIAFALATLANCVTLFFITQHFFAVRYPFKRLVILFAISTLCYLLSTFFGSGIEISSLTELQFDELTKWEKLTNAFSRIHYFPLIWKACCIFLWCGLIWVSGVLLPEDKEMIAKNIRWISQKFIARRLGFRQNVNS